MYKKDFPIFTNLTNLIYFDNGASSQRCKAAIEAVKHFYEYNNSNIHRGPHFLAEKATILYENARQTVADFIGAEDSREIIFTRNATEAINLVAHSFGNQLNKGDIIITSKLEHHANIVPWLQLKERRRIKLKFWDVTKDGRLDFDPSMINERVKLITITGMSNVMGSITDLKPIIKKAQSIGAKILVDAAQLAVHQKINVHQLDVDFLTFTGHKLYSPTGIGVLYGKKELLKKMPPFLSGGDMVKEVYTTHFTPAELPEKFEAGTPNIAGAIGLAATIDYIIKIGWDKIQKKEHQLTKYLLNKINKLPFIEIIGPADLKNRGSILSFNMNGVHPHDVAEGLSQKNICIRAGQHCAQPLIDKFGIPATARMSLAFYNTPDEIDIAVKVLEEIYEYFN